MSTKILSDAAAEIFGMVCNWEFQTAHQLSQEFVKTHEEVPEFVEIMANAENIEDAGVIAQDSIVAEFFGG